MNVGQFIETFRRERRDCNSSPLWQDEEIVGYLNDAVQEANERAWLTEDWTTPSVCEVELEEGVSTYRLHPSVLHVKQASLDGRVLCETSYEELACRWPGWRKATAAPRQYVFIPAKGNVPPSLQLVATPNQPGTLHLGVYRGALRELRANELTAEPELPRRFHRPLMDWVYRCAMLKQDADALNQTGSAQHEALFERSFGSRPDANVQRKHQDKRPPVVASSW